MQSAEDVGTGGDCLFRKGNGGCKVRVIADHSKRDPVVFSREVKKVEERVPTGFENSLHLQSSTCRKLPYKIPKTAILGFAKGPETGGPESRIGVTGIMLEFTIHNLNSGSDRKGFQFF